MANGINFSGLASGLDSGKIISQLVALETLPLDLLEVQKKDAKSKLTTLGTFKGLVKDLQKQADELATSANFLSFDVTPSQEGVANFSATGSASAGSHTLTVLSLAAVDRWAFNGVPSATTDLGAGQVQFSVGATAYTIDVASDASTLEEIAAAINDEAGDDVTASVVNAGTTANPNHQLVVTSKDSGEDFRITGLTSSVAGLTIDGTGPAPDGTAASLNNITVGSNAIAVVDGLTVEREDNEFDDVLPGVAITLESADPALTIHFSVQANDTAIKKQVQGFIDAYNKTVGFINTQSTYDEEGGPGGDLFGDSILLSVRKAINSALFNVDVDTVLADTEGYSTLGLVGIKTQKDGTLLIDNAVFDDKLAENLDALGDLFIDADGFDNGGALPNTAGYYTDTTSDSGLAAALSRAIDRMFDSFESQQGTVNKGVFDAKTATFNEAIKKFDKQIESKQFYLEQFEKNLIAKFTKLEEVIGGLNSQGAALQAALAGMIGG